jgi:hypothetical protein
MVTCTCYPSYMGGAGRRTEVQGWSWNKHETLYKKKKTKAKKGWGHGSSGRAAT